MFGKFYPTASFKDYITYVPLDNNDRVIIFKPKMYM